MTFGGSPAARHIPGLDTSRRPELLDENLIDEVVTVSEADTVTMCRAVARRGFLLGGSSGTVLAVARQWLSVHGGNEFALAISPDLGERYLDSVYDDDWVANHFPWIDLRRPDQCETLVGGRGIPG